MEDPETMVPKARIPIWSVTFLRKKTVFEFGGNKRIIWRKMNVEKTEGKDDEVYSICQHHLVCHRGF